VYEYLEPRDIGYVIHLPANDILEQKIRPMLQRPEVKLPRKPVTLYHDFLDQAKSWNRPWRVVAKMGWHRGELFPRVGFIITNLSAKPESVVHFYNGCGTAEQWIKEGEYALNWTGLSCHRLISNQVRLQLFVLAYNPGNFLRRLGLPKAIKDWSLRSLQVKLIKIGGWIVRRARQLVFQVAEVTLSENCLLPSSSE